MRIVVIVPLIVESDPMIEYTAKWLEHQAMLANYSVTEIAGNIKEKLPEHTICFIFDKPKNPLVKTMWLQFQLPSAIKKLGADMVLQLTGTASNRITVPQLLLIPSAEYLSARNFSFSWMKFFKEQLFKKNRLAKTIITGSEKINVLLRKEYNTDPRKVQTIFPLPYKQITELSYTEREEIKRELTGGAEFFYSDASFASIEEVLTLLKSFSVFQKWQRSNMLMVIKTLHKELLEEKLATYKFRLQVQLVDETEEVTGAAYAIIQPYQNIHLPAVMTAMQQNVALMLRDSIDLPSFPKDAFIPIETDIEMIGQAMIRMYKDEQQRNNLVTHAAEWLASVPETQQPRHLWKLLTDN